MKCLYENWGGEWFVFLGWHSFVVEFIQGWISTSSSEGKTNNKTVVLPEKVFLRFLIISICKRLKYYFLLFKIIEILIYSSDILFLWP